jgi:wyosine [tRNA(Phe)-imidazoG37] synthetase (radical SAM superfamily)
MPTVIYPSPIFGPVHSRRLGISLGVNLLPSDGKFCTFDCIYCECGFNADHKPTRPLPTREDVKTALENQLEIMVNDKQLPDVITFAGNGEPTMHPDFLDIVKDTVALRNKHCPKAKVAVLSNSTKIHKQSVHDALMLVDDNILKLDTADLQYIKTVNRPTGKYNLQEIIEDMKSFNGHIIIQTMFMKGTFKGIGVDNTGDKYVLPWLNAVKEIKPQQVMIYTIDRETPDHDLKKASHPELDRIANLLKAEGFSATASY